MKPLELQPLGESVCRKLAEEIRKLGFSEDGLPPLPDYAQASFSAVKDPYSGEDSLVGVWRNGRGDWRGEIKLHGDGSFYAEYDVALPHPTNPRWFVEGVVAWGRDGMLKSEPKLLPALG